MSILPTTNNEMRKRKNAADAWTANTTIDHEMDIDLTDNTHEHTPAIPAQDDFSTKTFKDDLRSTYNEIKDTIVSLWK